MKNILIIGCGLLGSSVLRSIHKNKLRLTIGSSRENLIFMNVVRKIFN